MSQTGEEFVCHGALCRCDKGVLPLPLAVTSQQTVTLQGRLMATTLDKVFPPFGTCALKNNTPCVPVLLLWQDYCTTVDLAVPGAYPLLAKSTLRCAVGGTVSVLTTLQLAIPAPPAPPQAEGIRTGSMAACPLLCHGEDGEADADETADADDSATTT